MSENQERKTSTSGLKAIFLFSINSSDTANTHNLEMNAENVYRNWMEQYVEFQTDASLCLWSSNRTDVNGNRSEPTKESIICSYEYESLWVGRIKFGSSACVHLKQVSSLLVLGATTYTATDDAHKANVRISFKKIAFVAVAHLQIK